MTDAPDPLGKRALYWAPANRVEDEPPLAGKEPVVAGKYALFSGAVPGEDHDPTAVHQRSAGLLPPVELRCSSCGTDSEVDVVAFLGLHVPFFLWRPGRGFTRFMTCPACRRRTWLSASWTPWSAR